MDGRTRRTIAARRDREDTFAAAPLYNPGAAEDEE